jgi:hypothetical protein
MQRCGFCLRSGFHKHYRPLHPSVPLSLLEDDASGTLVCTPCYDFLYHEYAARSKVRRRLIRGKRDEIYFSSFSSILSIDFASVR